jgi:hypothetical protein
MIPPSEPLRDDIPSLGDSTRPLSSTFLDDQLERDLLYRVISDEAANVHEALEAP